MITYPLHDTGPGFSAAHADEVDFAFTLTDCSLTGWAWEDSSSKGLLWPALFNSTITFTLGHVAGLTRPTLRWLTNWKWIISGSLSHNSSDGKSENFHFNFCVSCTWYSSLMNILSFEPDFIRLFRRFRQNFSKGPLSMDQSYVWINEGYWHLLITYEMLRVT